MKRFLPLILILALLLLTSCGAKTGGIHHARIEIENYGVVGFDPGALSEWRSEA